MLAGLFSFIAIFVAIETMYVQNWIGVSNRADAAYRNSLSLGNRTDSDNNKLAGLQNQLADTVLTFPKVLILFFSLTGSVTVGFALVFYYESSAVVGSSDLVGLGFAALAFLLLAIIVVSAYSFSEWRNNKTEWESVKAFMNDASPEHKTLADLDKLGGKN